MTIKDGREYRSFQMALAAQDEQKGYIVDGYATTFDVPYDFGPEGWKECVSSKSLIGADMSDVIFLMNHEGTPLARLRNKSLAIDCDAHGMHVRADLGGCEDGRRLYEAIKNGLVDRMSWSFRVARDGWEIDEETRTSTITKVSKVFDVSAVSIPADQDTSLHARSYIDGVIEQEHMAQEVRQRELQRARARALATLRLS